MASYFIFGAIGTCPECGDHRFSGPITIAPATSLTCHKCGHVATVEDAVRTGLADGRRQEAQRSSHRAEQSRARLTQGVRDAAIRASLV